MPKVLITDYAWPDTAIEREALAAAGHELVVGPAVPGATADIEALVRRHDPAAIMTCWAPVSAEAVALAPNLRAVARMGVGLDNIAVGACTQRGVWVTNVPDYCIEEVSDHAVGLLLAWTRGLVAFDRSVKAGAWDPASARLRRLGDLTVGLVSYGRIARRTAAKLAPWGCRVLVHNRSPLADPAVEQVAFDALLGQCDAVVIHVPLTPQTRHLFDADAFAAMKPGAFLINVSRGPVVDNVALEQALRDGSLGGAGLDVVEGEPSPPRGLTDLPQVLVTPHVAFSSDASLKDLRVKAVQCIVSALAGDRPPLNACNAGDIDKSAPVTLSTAIADIRAREILDSRGRPTVEVDVRLHGGATGRGVSPSGASTGASEAHELRDGDPAWYGGRGVGQAVANVNGELAQAVKGIDALDQAGLDQAMRDLDGTPQLRRLGANAILAVSLGACRAGAEAQGRPLHLRLAELSGGAPSLPMPMVNILSGGLHAGRGMDVQDFLIMPVGASDYRTALHWISKMRQAAADLMAAKGLTTLLADEGGLSPGYADSRQALEMMVRAVEAAGLRPGEDMAIALDVAASSLFENGAYPFRQAGQSYSAAQMIDLMDGWANDFPILSIEDGLAEEDWGNWRTLTTRLQRIQLVGDDLFTTNPERIRKGVALGVANSVLVKFNQNGTVTGTMEAIALARDAGYSTVISARSGETEDDFMSHLAVGTGGAQIKIGSVRNAERLAKYNTLLRLEDLHDLPYAGRSGLAGV